MPTHTISWCSSHNSPVVEGAEGDQDDFYLCQESNRTGDRTSCDIVEAQVRWKAS